MSWLQEEWGFTEEDIRRVHMELGIPSWCMPARYPFIEEGGWKVTPTTTSTPEYPCVPQTPAVPATPNLKQIEEYIEFLKQQKQQAVADHYRKEKEKGLVMELAAHFGLKVKFVEGAEGDHTQSPTKVK